MTQDWLAEQLKTIGNLCDIGLIIREHWNSDKREVLMPTILEQILVEAQAIVDDHCVVKE